MFVRGNFSSPPTTSTSIFENRRLGLIILILAVLLCLAFSLMLDNYVVAPFYQRQAATQTAQPPATRDPHMQSASRE